MLSGKRIIIGVTGGIAAYKAAFLLRAYQKEGAEVRVVMTPAATRFVGVETFSALTHHEVAVEVFPDNRSGNESWTQHISWGEWADLFVIAPCTANTLAKVAHGISDNMLTATVLAARCPLLICPTMDGEMYDAPAVQKNMDEVEKFGYHVLQPEEGYLASGLSGKGRLPDTDLILQKSMDILGQENNGPLKGKKVVVTAGPTREHIDPVRFISNPSSGKMGFAMAEAAQRLGGRVTLIHGPVNIPLPPGMECINFESAADLFRKVREHADADIIIMAAAVADFAPTQIRKQKVKKEQMDSSLELQRTQDILAWLGEHKKEGQTLIGFAMETEELIENARAKLTKKNADWIIANSLVEDGSGFESDTNTVYLLGKESRRKFSGTKKEVALQLLSFLFKEGN